MTEPDIVTIWEAEDGYRWHKRDPQGRTIAESGEAYTRRWSAKRAAYRANPDLRRKRGGAVLVYA